MKNIATINKSNSQVVSLKSVKADYSLSNTDSEFDVEIEKVDYELLSQFYSAETGLFSSQKA